MKNKILYIILFINIFIISSAVPTLAFWVWTPETNKFINPKYSVKDTPQEQLQFAIELYQAKKIDDAITEFQKLIKYYPRAKEAPEAQYYIALCLEEEGKLFKAFKNYQRVIDKYPFSEKTPDIVKKQYDIGIKLNEEQNNKSNLRRGILADGEYDPVEVFRKVIENAPYGPLAPQAQHKIGMYFMEKGMYQDARDEFEKLINDYPESDAAKSAKFQIALTDSKRSPDAGYDSKISQTAVEEFKTFSEEHPNNEFANDAKKHISSLREKEAENNFMIAQFYEKQKNYQSAKVYYGIVANEFSDTSWANKALKKIPEISQKEGKK